MKKGGKPVLTREERSLIERLRQITPQTRRLRVDEAVEMLRDMYAEYRRKPAPAFTEMVRRASDAIARDFVPKRVDNVPLPSIATSSSSNGAAANSTPDNAGQNEGSSDASSAAAAAQAAQAEAKKKKEAELLAKQKRLEEAGSVLNNALVEGYKRAVCFSFLFFSTLCCIMDLCCACISSKKGREKGRIHHERDYNECDGM